MRKLASIRVISEIRPIPNADAIELAIVDGWECVVAKKDNYKQGDKIIYIEIDSLLPECPDFEFMRKSKFRVRTKKLRGQISQGLVMPCEILPDGEYTVGDDVTEVLNIRKYMKEELRGEKVKKKPGVPFPEWISKTDEERIQNLVPLFEKCRDEKTKFMVTEKLDGTSTTYYLKKEDNGEYRFGICSRNLEIEPEGENSYVRVNERYQMETVLKSLIGDAESVVLQGETIGPKIQGNRYQLEESDFYAFNLIYPEKRLSTVEIAEKLKPFGIKTVPIMETEFTLPEKISDLVEYVKGNSVLVQRNREGCVFRNMEENISFKCISPEFLLEGN
ncbi:MAG: RNA ligase (ATP) [Oscillospiraceae bacterium]|nr:RNA ligase (ATP) [Oscillospiraceae bacterium]